MLRYARERDGQRVEVAVNLGAQPQRLALPGRSVQDLAPWAWHIDTGAAASPRTNREHA